MPSYSESFGMAAAEAMSYGLPILASNKVGISPLIRSYAAGCTVPCRTEEIEEALVSLLQNPSRLREMGANGRSAVESELSPAAIGRQLKREYAGIISRE
jgi:glycosyltransferase involved in cell wall biosynthesis